MADVPPIRINLFWEQQEADGTVCTICGEVAWMGHWIVWATMMDGSEQPLIDLSTMQTFCACTSCREALPLPPETCGSTG